LPRALQHLIMTLCLWTGLRIAYETYPVRQGLAEPLDLARKTEPGAVLNFSSPVPSRLPAFAGVQSEIEPKFVLCRFCMDGSVFDSKKGGTNEPRNRAEVFAGNAPFPSPISPSTPDGIYLAPKSPARQPKPWALSAWAIVRQDSGGAILSPSGQLGGSQAGFRVQRYLAEPLESVFVSANVRVSTPLRQSKGKEAGVGLAIRRPGKVPVEMIVERRAGLDRGGRDAFAGLVATGIDDVPVSSGFRLSGYVQAGLVGLRRHDGFADGSLRIEHEAAAIRGVGVRVGAGAWGAVQPGVSRVDVGPSITAQFRLGKARFRMAGEWRIRVAGKAKPGSGPALTLGVDY
jgi:hypothetical protein